MKKAKITAAFNKAATTYDKYAVLQSHAGCELLRELTNIANVPQNILDVGCGTGTLTQKLASTFPQAKITGIDIAADMVQWAKKAKNNSKQNPNLDFMVIDIDQHNGTSNKYDAIFSNLMLQWSLDLTTTFNKINLLAATNGAFCFSILGKSSLNELRKAWLTVDQHPHVYDFLTTAQVKAYLHQTKWINIKFYTKTYIRFFKNFKDLLLEIKNVGAHFSSSSNSGLYGKKKFQELEATYAKLHSTNGLLPLTYEIHFFTAKKDDANI